MVCNSVNYCILEKQVHTYLLFTFLGIVSALYSSEEYVIDPYLMVLSNLYVALYHGCQLETRCRVTSMEKDKKSGSWKVFVEKRSLSGGKLSKTFYLAQKVINCGGNYSDELDLFLPRTIDESKPFVIQPGCCVKLQCCQLCS